MSQLTRAVSFSQVFQFDGKDLRVAVIDGELWWPAVDVCRALDLKGDPGQHTRRLDEDEKGLISIQTPGGIQQILMVSEPGLYALTLGSRRPEAKAFKRWITHDVVPTIRRTGSYSLPGYQPQPQPERVRVITRIWRGHSIDQRASDGYLDAHALEALVAVPLSVYFNSDAAAAFVPLLADELRLAPAQLLGFDPLRDGLTLDAVVWMHPRVAEHYAAPYSEIASVIPTWTLPAEPASNPAIDFEHPLGRANFLRAIAGMADEQVQLRAEHEALAARVEEQKATIEAQARQLEALDAARREGQEQLEAVELSKDPAKPKTTRVLIRQIVAAYCKSRGVGYSEVFNWLYQELLYRYGFDAKARVRNRKAGTSHLDVVEEGGMIGPLYSIASQLLGGPVQAVSPPPERLVRGE